MKAILGDLIFGGKPTAGVEPAPMKSRISWDRCSDTFTNSVTSAKMVWCGLTPS